MWERGCERVESVSVRERGCECVGGSGVWERGRGVSGVGGEGEVGRESEELREEDGSCVGVVWGMV